MSKNEGQNHDDASEYLARVERESNQVHNRIPLHWYMITKWSYKKIAAVGTPDEKLTLRIVGVLIIAICGSIVYFLGGKALLPFQIGLLFFGIFFYFAICDASKNTSVDNHE